MKKSSLQSLVSFLDGETVTNLDAIKAELVAELNKGKAKAEANRALYADMHDKVMTVLDGAFGPVSAQEIADAAGLARGKIVYGLTNYWSSEVVKHPGKVATYTKA